MTISLRRLSDKTLAKYETAEKDGTLTPRQEKALAGHRSIRRFVDLYVEAHFGHKRKRKGGTNISISRMR